MYLTALCITLAVLWWYLASIRDELRRIADCLEEPAGERPPTELVRLGETNS